MTVELWRDDEREAWAVRGGDGAVRLCERYVEAAELFHEFQRRATTPRKVPAGQVEYRSPLGSRVRFRKARFNLVLPSGEVVNKAFRYEHQPQPPDGQWLRKKPACADRTLYRLPELRAALAGGRGAVVYWCEGESDADAVAAELHLPTPPPGQDLASLRTAEMRRGKGMDAYRRAVESERRRIARWWKATQTEGWPAAATSHHGGAAHVTAEQAALFRGFRGRVVVVADLDAPGAADAVLRRGLLVDVAGLDARRVTVAAPAAGKDARDHLRAGKGLDRLREARERDLRRTAREYIAEKNTAAEARGYLRTRAALSLVERYSQKRKK
ncbi:hypothetical protein [Actinomycetospora cinnamomea]|uniref:Uncharacterized protein n=1 Tax=Actinomycetospora cinnamomea TaxID=663609 RepID=A0A2U1FD73_9PSEU|nr:hypothetical protein [Actinomycetospora cinnamomea]PVZ10155.1 hypothetical protein C8D89_105232 [Actinomycetospora cinnamomea]